MPSVLEAARQKFFNSLLSNGVLTFSNYNVGKGKT